MNRIGITELARMLSSKHNMSQADAENFVRLMFAVVGDGLEQEKLVKIKSFGTFKMGSVKDRESVDVNTGERIVIEGRNKINFTPDNALRDFVNRPFAQFETVMINDGVDFEAVDRKYESIGDDAPPSSDTPEQAGPMEDQAQKAEKPTKAGVEEAPIQVVEEVPAPIVEEALSPVTEEEPAPIVEEGPAPVVEAQPAVAAEASVEQEPRPLSSASPSVPPVSPLVSSEPPSVPSAPSVSSAAAGFSDSRVNRNAVSAPPPPSSELPSRPTPAAPAPDSRRISVSRPVVYLFSLLLFALVGGACWLAYSYGKLAAERDHLHQRLSELSHPQAPSVRRQSPAAPASAASPSAAPVDSAAAMKAKADSARLARQAAIVAATATAGEETRRHTREANRQQAAPAPKAKVQQPAPRPQSASGRYDADPRVRTGAYRIVGTAQTVTAKRGQTMAKISRAYLGPGMECYVEALNGTSEVKEGQRVKIPKLELKRK
ncbi:HU family DNA-binding protein [Segatella buccae]|uniref:HU family DNA-binding protein n=1 Tax=Segatella buccae TaxID=28126 RepID=UPI0036F2402D